MEIKGQGKITLLCSSLSAGCFCLQKSIWLQGGVQEPTRSAGLRVGGECQVAQGKR